MSYKLSIINDGIESARAFRNRHDVVRKDDKNLGSSGIPLDEYDGKVSHSKNDEHCLIVGSTGTGKSRRLMMPGIVMSARAGRSLLIMDVKGELYAHTAKVVREAGHDVRVINLRNPICGCRFNPLKRIQELWMMQCKSAATLLLRDVGRVITASLAHDRDSYWQLSTIEAFMGFAILIMENGYTLTFAAVHALFNEWMRKKDVWEVMRPMFDSQAESYKHLSTIINLTADTTVSCITSTFNVAMSPFVDSEDVRDMLGESDFMLEDIGQRKMAVYLIVPDESLSLYSIASVFVDQTYSSLIRVSNAYADGKLSIPVDFYLDEFGTISGLDWSNKLAAARSRNVRFFLAIQDLSQLTEKYGEYPAKTIMSNCKTLVFLGGRDLELMSTISWLSGKKSNGKPVISIVELNEIKPGTIVVIDGPKPFYGHLPDWVEWHIPELSCVDDNERDLIVQRIPELTDLLSPSDKKENTIPDKNVAN